MISAQIQLTDQDARTVSSARGNARVGQTASTNDGRVFTYAQAGAVALAPGKISITPAIVANHQGMIPAATAAGATTVTVALGATAATADQYADGYLTVIVTPGVGVSYKILGNTAAASSANCTFTLVEPISVALTTTSRVSVTAHPNSALIVAPGDSAAYQSIGVNSVNVPISNYGWFQTRGYCSVLSAGIITKGANAIVSASVAGAATINLAASVTQVVGYAPEATVDTQYQPLFLMVL